MIQSVVTELCKTSVLKYLVLYLTKGKSLINVPSRIAASCFNKDVKLARSQEMMERLKPQWQEEQGNGRKIDQMIFQRSPAVSIMSPRLSI